MSRKEYGMKMVRKVRALTETMASAQEISRHVEPCAHTIARWDEMGLIDTGPSSKHPRPKVEEADRLYDKMPLPDVSDAIDVPESTVQRWNKRGWISTEVNWLSERTGRKVEVPRRRIVETYFEGDDRSYDDVAEMIGVSSSTVGYYIRKYKRGEIDYS